MSPRFLRTFAVALAGLLATQTALAHPSAFHASGFAAGFAHPFLGLDHVLAMIAVGVWAMQLRARARGVAPVAFVIAIAVGGALALTTNVALPNVEAGIAATVLALGLLIALAIRMPALAGAALASVFGIWHGYAHGAELPAAASSSLSYATGFVLASALLVAVGSAAGRATVPTSLAARTIGASIAAAGIMLLAGA